METTIVYKDYIDVIFLKSPQHYPPITEHPMERKMENEMKTEIM